MRCTSCDHDDTKVIDSRAVENGAAIRRRRACIECGRRFTTFERLEEVPLMVIKSSGHRVPFDRDNIVRGLRAAAKGRPVDEASFDEIAVGIEDSARLDGVDVTSESIGLAVLDRLRVVDEVAALRFASVYKDFTEASDFERELSLIKRDCAAEVRAQDVTGELI